METITFSDNTELSKDVSVTVQLDGSESAILSLEEHCKRHPEALECREYDV
jgi:hypothetical protein